MSLLEVLNLKKTYDNKRYVLNDLNFSIKRGEIATILGASGCGKSTFLNIMGMLDTPTDGEYIFEGKKIERNNLNLYNKIRAKDIGFIFQSYCLIEYLTVQENVLMPFLYNGLEITDSVYKEIDELLYKLKLDKVKNKRVSLLSGGEKQRVAIVRAMIKNPKLIIADEPTGNLDDINAISVINAFCDIAKKGTSIIVVTHNKYLSFGSGNKYELKEGKLV